MGLFGGSKKSTSTSNTTAIDQRLVVSENGIGASVSGSGNVVQMLDGGAIQGGLDLAGAALAGSLQFAENALSKMLFSVIEGQKQASAETSATIGQAMTQAAQVQAAASEKSLTWMETSGKKLLIGATLVAAGWYVWKGR